VCRNAWNPIAGLILAATQASADLPGDLRVGWYLEKLAGIILRAALGICSQWFGRRAHYMYFRLNSSPSFREKLAEREEAIPSCKALFHRDIFNALNIRTIEINLDWPASTSCAAFARTMIHFIGIY
jgi:hypothetical protein